MQPPAAPTGLLGESLELDSGHVLLAGRHPDISLDTWIFAGDHSMINSVWVAGRRRVGRGHHAGEDELRKRFSNVLAELQIP